MSRYLVDQLAGRPNIEVLVNAQIAAAHGDASIEAIDIADSESGDTTRHDTGGLYIFIGADAETSWLPEEIALDPRGYVLTGTDVSAAGRWGRRSATRTCWRRASPASSRWVTCGSAR